MSFYKNGKGDCVFYEKGKKRAICSCTNATGEYLHDLINEYEDFNEVLKNIHYDEEAKQVMEYLISLGFVNKKEKIKPKKEKK